MCRYIEIGTPRDICIQQCDLLFYKPNASAFDCELADDPDEEDVLDEGSEEEDEIIEPNPDDNPETVGNEVVVESQPEEVGTPAKSPPSTFVKADPPASTPTPQPKKSKKSSEALAEPVEEPNPYPMGTLNYWFLMHSDPDTHTHYKARLTHEALTRTTRTQHIQLSCSHGLRKTICFPILWLKRFG